MPCFTRMWRDCPQACSFKSLEAAARENEELFRKFFMAQPVELGSHKYAALHKARLSTGALLYVPRNVEVALPVEIFHWVEGENARIFPHTLVVCGENSKITVIDHFRSADGKRAFACGVNDLHLERGAQLNYIAVQEWATRLAGLSPEFHNCGAGCLIHRAEHQLRRRIRPRRISQPSRRRRSSQRHAVSETRCEGSARSINGRCRTTPRPMPRAICSTSIRSMTLREQSLRGLSRSSAARIRQMLTRKCAT